MIERRGWRKSSCSGASENCVEVSKQAWRKSSYSGGRENCVEVADLPGATGVRDSKFPEAAVLAFPPAEWSAFLAGVREG
nr:DUF397 domain-containing protein [Nocardiopsis baichengensis]